MTITIKKIAEELGVAPSTVSYVLNDRYKGTYKKTAERAEKIKAYALERGYRPNAAARAIRAQRTYQIGAVLPHRSTVIHTHPNAFDSLLGVNAGFQEAGYIVSVVRLDDLTRKDVASRTKLFSEKVLEGLVVMGHHPEWMIEEFQSLVPRILWLDTNVWQDHNCIQRDEEAAGKAAVTDLLASGYKHILWLGYPDNPDHSHYSHTRRWIGAESVAKKAGLEVERLQLKPDAEHHAPWEDLWHLLSPETAVVTETVYHAQYFAHTLSERNLIAPRDFGLVCCDDSQEIQRLWPGLSRVSFDRYAMGQQAAEMLRESIENSEGSTPSRILRNESVPGKTLRDPSKL
ncbi:LacI family DNA-binding transcriptional regulator [Kiritimatiellaeota bacterium B1221]|nr:LacI family DNA-binding transcriptional regulator [Kiritimatiellaeota bacterium B1221]